MKVIPREKVMEMFQEREKYLTELLKELKKK